MIQKIPADDDNSKGAKKKKIVAATEHQLQFWDISYEAFVEKTNVVSLIESEYFEKFPEATSIPPEVMQNCKDHLYSRLRKVSKWQSCALKDLRWKPVEKEPVRNRAVRIQLN